MLPKRPLIDMVEDMGNKIMVEDMVNKIMVDMAYSIIEADLDLVED